VDYSRLVNATPTSVVDDDSVNAPSETVTPIIDVDNPSAAVTYLNQRIDFEYKSDLICEPLKCRRYAKHLNHPYNNTLTRTSTEVIR